MPRGGGGGGMGPFEIDGAITCTKDRNCCYILTYFKDVDFKVPKDRQDLITNNASFYI